MSEPDHNSVGDNRMFKKTPLAYAISCAVAFSALGISQNAFAQDQDVAQEFDETVL